MTRPSRRLRDSARTALGEVDRLDRAVYVAIAATPTPTLDEGLRRLSNAANYSRLWIGIGAGLAVVGGRPGRRAAAHGLVAVGVSSFTANVLGKQLLVRSRPDRDAAAVVVSRQVRMPTSTSFPSGHTASAFAFATAVGADLPVLALPLHLLAATVGYSRVHTGVHYPGDVVAGAVLGSTAGSVVGGLMRVINRRCSGS
jgi:undecaprenyl-diphosphatase